MKTAEKPNYKRYIFNEDLTVTNRATGVLIKKEVQGEKSYHRLTDDEGKRGYVYDHQIEELFAAPVEAPVVPEEKPATTGTIVVDGDKTPRAKKSENQAVKHGNRYLNYNGNGKRRVTEDEVREIRKLAAGNPEKGVEPMPQNQICTEFQIHNSTCSNIIKRKLHPNVK